MARSTQDIQNEIIANVQADANLAGASSTSKTAMWRLITYVVAYSINLLEKIYDALRAEILDLLARLKPHTLRWYAEKAEAFQYGFNLLPDSDQFNNTGYTEEQIEASKVVKYAAIVEQQSQTGRTILRIKLATTNESDLEPLTTPQLNAFRNYMARIKDAGVPLQIDSLPPDKIKATWKVYYDPLILAADGSRLDGTDAAPVKTAIKKYLENLPFNGTYVLAFHVDAVQKIEGVVIPHIVSCSTSYGAYPFSTVNVLYEPDAGYLRFSQDSDLTIEYVAQSAIQ